jgi:glycerol 3-phosphatase-2
VHATAGSRPDYIGADLRSLYDAAENLRVGPHPAWHVEVGSSGVTVTSTGQDAGNALSVVRAAASAVWNADLDGGPATLTAGDDTARQAMDVWSLLAPPNRLA